MLNIVLTIHLILALCLIGVVLLQRSEGGGLGIGGGGGVMTGRAAATALSKVTWIFAIAFIITSLVLTVLAARDASTGSVIDQIGGEAPVTAPVAPGLPPASELLPPPRSDAPAAPPRAE
ncbi:preprotein translocase subunit SecG [Ruixingdingia sedimenti]|uniref:Protein-export membrane protein SecG n=1 Tax=Ruixingdingia sedimenti TaxID=3073604 RepID=A0ABU1F6M0_9RHOB|nr:preprotein translocase subunit SecG [Xinfangfangia sp. LG-4]MDR5652519.1 preprotein translocase subunit SecG [Xinfangfangia sp. LG-4]